MSSWWIKPERKATDINCANKITLRGGCSSWNLPSPCCYGYLQQVAQWEWLCHQQRIREAQLGEALTPECNGTAESDKGGGSEEKWWEAFPAKHHPRASPHTLAQARAHTCTPVCFKSAPTLLLPVSYKGPTYLPEVSHYTLPWIILFHYLCPLFLRDCAEKTSFTGWTEVCLEIFLIWGWIALISSTRSTRVAGFRTDACLGGCPSFSCPESLDKFQGFSLCLWIQIVQV